MYTKTGPHGDRLYNSIISLHRTCGCHYFCCRILVINIRTMDPFVSNYCTSEIVWNRVVPIQNFSPTVVNAKKCDDDHHEHIVHITTLMREGYILNIPRYRAFIDVPHPLCNKYLRTLRRIPSPSYIAPLLRRHDLTAKIHIILMISNHNRGHYMNR